MKCKNCGKEFTEKYSKWSNGDFCKKECARSFSSKEKRKEINEKISLKLKGRNEHIWNRKHNEINWDRNKRICITYSNFFIPKTKNQKCCNIVCARINNIKHAQESSYKNDMSKNNKKAYQNGRKVSGGRTKWYEYKNIKVQGTYELRACKIFDNWKQKNIIKDWEYTKDRFEYIGVDGNKHSYLLDFKIYENDNCFYYIETKGYIRENDELKWKSVKDKGYKIEIWFKETLEKYEK